MKVARQFVFFAAVSAAFLVCARDVVDFCDGWEFSRDQTTWRAVEVPHDWAIEGPFEPEGNPDTGKLPWKGVGYYRKALILSDAPKGRRIFLDFDGIMCDGTVYVNGQPCANQPYGYLGVRADATPYLFGGTNTIVVKADTTKLSSRWYPGAGMYRRVRKIETGDVYLDDGDVFVSPSVSGNGDDGLWLVQVRCGIVSRRTESASVNVKVSLRSPRGDVVASGSCSTAVGMGGKTSYAVSLEVRDPDLWEMKPNAALYTAEISLSSPDGKVEDEITVPTGFRTFRFDADKGFFLNGRRVQLNGSCLHSDLGILGMAFNRSAMRRELLALMDMGVNALRTSHNPPSPELLDLCDELGIFVWDECFDKWNATCGRGDIPLEEFVSAKLEEFVRRDRNHPCVFVWSIGNEISPGKACPPGQEHWAGSPALGTSAERCARFRDAVLRLDVTRPVGIGSCFPDAVKKGDYAPLDITGWNYKEQYMPMRNLYPEKPLIYSESASALSDYGDYADVLPSHKQDYDVKNLSVDSYDRNAAPWSDIPDLEFERMERDLFVAGEFVWTGVDYLGEPTPYARGIVKDADLDVKDLSRSSYFGVYDLLVLPKDRVWLYRSHWNKNSFTLHIVPEHWNFTKKSLPVYVYTSADEAELFLNGVSLGRRKKDRNASFKDGYYAVLPRYRLIWENVEYVPGELRAVAYGPDGSVLGEEVVRTAGGASKVVLRPESRVIPDDPREYVFVEVSIADTNDVRVPNDRRRVSFAVEGPGRIVSVGNSDPHGMDCFKDVASHPLYNGRAGLFIRRTGSGPVRLVASSAGLCAATVEFGTLDIPASNDASGQGAFRTKE